MKRSMKFGIVLLSLLMALSFGVAFGEKTVVADKAISTNDISMEKSVNAESGTIDAADAGENESVDENENGEDDTVDAADAGENESVDVNENGEDDTVDAADAEENESVDENESGEDSIIINGVTCSPSSTYIELKNNETSEQNLTGWKVNVLNETVFTFPQFTLGANALVKVHAGVGEDNKTDIYAANSLITKAGDEVSLLDASGAIVGSSEESNEKSDSQEDV